MAGPVTPRGVNHLVLNVRDLEESHHFWSDLLGFRQVGELKGRNGEPAAMTMRFYSGVVDDVNHHDIALVEQPDLPPPPDEWSMGMQMCRYLQCPEEEEEEVEAEAPGLSRPTMASTTGRRRPRLRRQGPRDHLGHLTWRE